MYTSEWCVSGTEPGHAGTLTVDDVNPREVVLVYIGSLRDIDECTWCPGDHRP